MNQKLTNKNFYCFHFLVHTYIHTDIRLVVDIFIIKETCQISLWNMDINNENNWRRRINSSTANKYYNVSQLVQQIHTHTFIETLQHTHWHIHSYCNIFTLSAKSFWNKLWICGTVDSKTWQCLINKVCCFCCGCCCFYNITKHEHFSLYDFIIWICIYQK